VRKGRKKAAVKPKKNSRTTKQPDIEISDQDMQNAASQGAKKILPAGVKKIMKEFGANKVVDIPQSARREFLDQLAAAG
jgi:glutamate 5-kinase